MNKFLVFLAVIFLLGFASSLELTNYTQKWEFCSAKNLTGTGCDSWWASQFTGNETASYNFNESNFYNASKINSLLDDLEDDLKEDFSNFTTNITINATNESFISREEFEEFLSKFDELLNSKNDYDDISELLDVRFNEFADDYNLSKNNSNKDVGWIFLSIILLLILVAVFFYSRRKPEKQYGSPTEEEAKKFMEIYKKINEKNNSSEEKKK